MAERNNGHYTQKNNNRSDINYSRMSHKSRDNSKLVRKNESVESLRRKKAPENARPQRTRMPRNNALSRNSSKTIEIYSESFEKEFKPNNSRAISPARRKLRKITFFAVFLLVSAIVGAVLSLTVFFKAENITVSYSDKVKPKYTQEQIIEAAKLTKGKNLFLSDKSAAAERVTAAFPYIEKTKVDISLPSTLAITVTQATPTYYAELSKNKYIVLGADSRVIEQSAKMTYSIPLLKGVKLKNTSVGEYAEFENKSIKSILNSVITAAKGHDISDINEIDLSLLSNITFKYGDRINIILGTNDDLDYKIRTALTIIKDKLGKKEKGTLDVSACNRGNHQSSFLPANMENTENTASVSSDTDSGTDTETEAETPQDNGDYNDHYDNNAYDNGDYYDDNYDNYDDNYDNYDDNYDNYDDNYDGYDDNYDDYTYDNYDG